MITTLPKIARAADRSAGAGILEFGLGAIGIGAVHHDFDLRKCEAGQTKVKVYVQLLDLKETLSQQMFIPTRTQG